MKKLLTVILVVGLVGTASAEYSGVGSSGAQFLKIGVGSRYQGMGGAAVAVANDVYSAFWNPAGLAAVENSGISFTNVNWALDINLNYVAFARQFEDVGVFGLSAAVMSMGSQEITTFEEPDGTGQSYTASSYAVGLSFARQLTARFAFGATVKYVGERIHLETSRGIAFDFGTQLHTGFRSLRLGMSITNMGPEMKFSGPSLDVSYDDDSPDPDATSKIGATLKTTPYDMPLAFKVGLAYDFEFGPSSLLTLCGELQHPNDAAEQGALGAEFGYAEHFFLRTGYKLNHDEETISFGGGLSAPVTDGSSLVIDYSWQDLGRLDSGQRFSVGFSFF